MAQTYCGILIGNEELRAIELKSHRGVLSIAGAATHDLTGEERTAPGASLRAMLKRMKPPPDSAALCLPKEQATLQLVTLPSRDPKELKEMARFEAERHIPFNAERHGVGFQVLREAGTGGSETLLVAADGPFIDRALSAASEAGVQPEGLNVSSACLMNALLHAQPDLVGNQTVAIVSVGLGSLDLVFVSQGRIVFSRSAPIGLRALIQDWHASQGGGSVMLDAARIAAASKMIDMMDLDQNYGEPPRAGAQASSKPADSARAWAGKLIQELRRSYDFARREMNCPALETLVLAGEGSILRNLGQYLYVNLNAPVMTLNPVGTVGGEEIRQLPFGGLELTVPFGAAIQNLTEGAVRPDLIPADYYQRLERRMLARRGAITGVLALLLIGLGTGAGIKHRLQENRLTKAYDETNEILRPHVSKLKDQEAKLNILEGFLDDPSNALAVLRRISDYKAAPERVSVKSVAYTKGDQTVIEGHAREIVDVNNFAEDLRASKLFDDVKIVEQKLFAALSQRPQVYVFRIQCALPKYKAKPKARRTTGKENHPLSPGIGSRETEAGGGLPEAVVPLGGLPAETETTEDAQVLPLPETPTATRPATQPAAPPAMEGNP